MTSKPAPRNVRRRKLRAPALVAAGVLLAAPLVALLWVGTYNRETPSLGGMPFFYWYQFMWVLIAAAATFTAYLITTRTGVDVEFEETRDGDEVDR